MKANHPASRKHRKTAASRAKTGQSPLQKAAAASLRVQDLATLQSMATDSEVTQGLSNIAPVQRKTTAATRPNNTGLPDNLKSGIENLSGMSMDHVKVHRNSDKPATVQAHAYAQGSDIHLGPGQEQHLPHEAWHVVQQAQGRVKLTIQLKGVAVNNDPGLEREADVMGAKALHAAQSDAQQHSGGHKQGNFSNNDVQQHAAFLNVKRVAASGNLFMGKSTAGAPSLGHGGGTNWYGPKVTAAEYGQPPGAVWRATAKHNLNLLDMSTSDSVKKIMDETARRRGVAGLSPGLTAALGNHDFAYAIPNATADVADAYLNYAQEFHAGNAPAWPGDHYNVTQADMDAALTAYPFAPAFLPMVAGAMIQPFAGVNSPQAVALNNAGFLANPDNYRMIRKDATNLDAGFADALLNNLNDPNLFHGLHVPQGMKFGGWTGTKFEVLIKNSPANLNLHPSVAVPGPEADFAVTDKTISVDNSLLSWAWWLFGGNS